MGKVLSILIPVYNTEKYIKRCLDSILLNEIKEDIEVIIVNDGGKDKSLEIAKKYHKKFPETIVIIDKENGGHGSTINKGIEVAIGKYFRVLDSDDWFQSSDFIKFVELLKNETADLVISNYRQEHIYNSNSIFLEYKKLIPNQIYDFNSFDLSLLVGEYFVMATSTYKLDVLKKSQLHLMEKTFYVDMQYNVVPILEVENFTFYNLDIYRYFIGRKDQSMNLTSFVRNQDHHERVMRYLIEYYVSKKDKISTNKEQYIKIILKYMLNTHYTIYCMYDNDHKNAYKKIRMFDNYLKDTCLELYELTNDITYINQNRKYKFFFVIFGSKTFNRLFSVARVLKRRSKGI